MAIDLRLLPAPEIIKTLAYEELLSATTARLVEMYDEKGVNYDVGNLETDPAIIIAETKAYDELLLYALANDVARSNLLYFSEGGDLDQYVASDVTRMTDESDDRLRTRYILTRLGRSEERYSSAAMKADVNVEDVRVYRLGQGPELEVAILSADNDGIATQTLLDAVAAIIDTQSGRAINDVLTVVSAVRTQVDIQAKVWLEPGADFATVGLLETYVKDAWNILSVMGLDLVPSWVIRELHRVGVQRIELTNFTDPIVAQPNEAIAINSVTIDYQGRDY